ncbi:MAG TPA: ATP-binding protein [Solirubrobacteraceae bacterium]|jgi:anti-sigma regulatory factor (Ser/Thr protein kinase)|nr:ATP-binding protein [Solirubrobacteraceae bacterium]
MSEPPNVCLTLSNQPDNVLLVRETLSGMAETVGVDAVDLNDIRTAVTEACNNVVLHAYGGGEGPLQIEIFLGSEAVEIVVRDNGTGIKPHIRTDEEAALGIGLSIIQALAPRVEFKDVVGGGTEVRMEFAAASTRALDALQRNGFQAPEVHGAELSRTELAVAPDELARNVLPRVMCVLAARAHFTTDRISDTELVADALVSEAFASSTGHHLNVALTVEPRSLAVVVGPLDAGSAERVIASSPGDGVGPVIEKLTDDRHVAANGSAEMLELHLRDER